MRPHFLYLQQVPSLLFHQWVPWGLYRPWGLRRLCLQKALSHQHLPLGRKGPCLPWGQAGLYLLQVQLLLFLPLLPRPL